MKRVTSLTLTILLLAIVGCGPAEVAENTSESAPEEQVAEPPPTAEPVVQSNGLLPHPYTADQIRDAWQEGLVLKIGQKTPAGESLERWTVVTADAEGADVKYTTLAPDGSPLGSSRTQRSTWVELRDHASFPADGGKREKVSQRETPLGPLDGWLYTIQDEDSGVVSTFFFANDFPGAPVYMQVTKDGAVITEMEQLERTAPTAP